jgi:hypothetical protein
MIKASCPFCQETLYADGFEQYKCNYCINPLYIHDRLNGIIYEEYVTWAYELSFCISHKRNTTSIFLWDVEHCHWRLTVTLKDVKIPIDSSLERLKKLALFI